MSTLEMGQANLVALASEILGRGSSLRFRARGVSMQPFVRDGDILEVQPLGFAALRRGDVVLCCPGGSRLVAHRVARIIREKNGATAMATQGDALTCPDAPVPVEQVLGHVVAVERNGKYIRLDTQLQRLAGILWMRLSPCGQWLHCAWAALGRRIYSR